MSDFKRIPLVRGEVSGNVVPFPEDGVNNDPPELLDLVVWRGVNERAQNDHVGVVLSVGEGCCDRSDFGEWAAFLLPAVVVLWMDGAITHGIPRGRLLTLFHAPTQAGFDRVSKLYDTAKVSPTAYIQERIELRFEEFPFKSILGAFPLNESGMVSLHAHFGSLMLSDDLDVIGRHIQECADSGTRCPITEDPKKLFAGLLALSERGGRS